MDKEEYYNKASEYWSNIPATVDGMLGGLSKVSPADISFSKTFLTSFIFDSSKPLSTRLALDVGAGIGRVTKHLLSQFFQSVDLLEANSKFLDAAPAYIGPDLFKKVRKVFPVALQDFDCDAESSSGENGEPMKYDCVWCQWVLTHLRDDDLVLALQRLQRALNREGNAMIFVKENIAKIADEHDPVDNSVTRTRQSYLKVFNKAGLMVVKEAKQTRFPQDLYEVRLFALQPKDA